MRALPHSALPAGPLPPRRRSGAARPRAVRPARRTHAGAQVLVPDHVPCWQAPRCSAVGLRPSYKRTEGVVRGCPLGAAWTRRLRRGVSRTECEVHSGRGLAPQCVHSRQHHPCPHCQGGRGGARPALPHSVHQAGSTASQLHHDGAHACRVGHPQAAIMTWHFYRTYDVGQLAALARLRQQPVAALPPGVKATDGAELQCHQLPIQPAPQAIQKREITDRA